MKNIQHGVVRSDANYIARYDTAVWIAINAEFLPNEKMV